MKWTIPQKIKMNIECLGDKDEENTRKVFDYINSVIGMLNNLEKIIDHQDRILKNQDTVLKIQRELLRREGIEIEES